LKYSIYISLFCFFLVSCSIPIDELPETKSKIIVQCEFSSGQDIDVYVYKGVGLPSFESLPEVPDSINIKMYVDFDYLAIHQTENASPHFQADFSAIPGQRFNLNIDMPFEGIEPVNASTIVPLSSNMNNIQVNLLTDTIIDERRMSHVLLNFNIEDKNEEKYFELLIDRVQLAEIVEPVDTIWHEINLETDKVLLDPTKDPVRGITWLSERRSFLIDYYELEDKNISIPFSLDSPVSDRLSLLRYTLKTHTKDGFEFIKSYEKTKLNYQSDFPILVSNIENGIGVFTAYNQSVTDQVISH
jgi:hypothetical protein